MPEREQGARSGFTLVELLAAISIAVLLLAVTGVTYFGLRHKLAVRAGVNQVDSAFRFARNSAANLRETSIVRWSNVSGPVGLRPVGRISTEIAGRLGLWHFEDTNAAANEFLGMFAIGPRLFGNSQISDQTAKLFPGTLPISDAIAEGVLGQGALFASTSYLQCGLYRVDQGWVPNPAFNRVYEFGSNRTDDQGLGDDTGGFVISGWWRPLEETRSDGASGLRGTLVTKYAEMNPTGPGPHAGYLLEILPSGAAYAYVRLAKEGSSAHEERAATAGFRFSPRRWSKIEMRWYAGQPLGQQVQLLVDGADLTVRLTEDAPANANWIRVSNTRGFDNAGQISVVDSVGIERIIAYTSRALTAFYVPAPGISSALSEGAAVAPADAVAPYTDSCPEPMSGADKYFLYLNLPLTTDDTTEGEFLGYVDEFEFKHLFVSESSELGNALRFAAEGALQIDAQGRVPEAAGSGHKFLILLDNSVRTVVGGSTPIPPASIGPLRAARAHGFPASGLAAIGTENPTDATFTLKELVRYEKTGADAGTGEEQFVGLSRNYRGATNNSTENILPGDVIYRGLLVTVSSLAAASFDDGSASGG